MTSSTAASFDTSKIREIMAAPIPNMADMLLKGRMKENIQKGC